MVDAERKLVRRRHVRDRAPRRRAMPAATSRPSPSTGTGTSRAPAPSERARARPGSRALRSRPHRRARAAAARPDRAPAASRDTTMIWSGVQRTPRASRRCAAIASRSGGSRPDRRSRRRSRVGARQRRATIRDHSLERELVERRHAEAERPRRPPATGQRASTRSARPRESRGRSGAARRGARHGARTETRPAGRGVTKVPAPTRPSR